MANNDAAPKSLTINFYTQLPLFGKEVTLTA